MTMEWIRRILVSAALCLLFLATPTLRADDTAPTGDKGGKMHDRMMNHMKEALGLSDDQVSKLKDENKANREASKPLREKMTLDKDNLKLLVDKKASDDDLKAAIASLKEDRKAMQALNQKHMDAMQEILTPMQQAKAIFMMHGHRGHGWGHGAGMDKDGAGMHADDGADTGADPGAAASSPAM
jgi:Spy/CpxP family protein refolding chaperone